VKDSTPGFPKEVEAPKGAPNILLILTDHVGFGARSTFGGPIQTPTVSACRRGASIQHRPDDRAVLTERAAPNTGRRSHHSCARGVITEFATGYPGYDGGGICKGATETLLVEGTRSRRVRLLVRCRSTSHSMRRSMSERAERQAGRRGLRGQDAVPLLRDVKKFVVVLEPQKLSEEERQRLRREEAQAGQGDSMRVSPA
jgi:hypothetical protein